MHEDFAGEEGRFPKEREEESSLFKNEGISELEETEEDDLMNATRRTFPEPTVPAMIESSPSGKLRLRSLRVKSDESLSSSSGVA